MDFAFVLLIAFAVFLVVFVRTELGLYLVIFSMLLSPEIGAGSSELAEGRQVVIRTEDLVLLVVAFSWLAKTAVNKELGLALKTPLNRPILWYVAVTTIATLVGYATGTVQGLGGFFYVLKYTEYFVVYYMVANNLSNRSQAWRFVAAAFLPPPSSVSSAPPRSRRASGCPRHSRGLRASRTPSEAIWSS